MLGMHRFVSSCSDDPRFTGFCSADPDYRQCSFKSIPPGRNVYPRRICSNTQVSYPVYFLNIALTLVSKSYFNTQQTVANWTVRTPTVDPAKPTAKNILFFIGDGMTISMQTAARVMAHKSINGKYQSLLQLDQVSDESIC